MLYDSLLNRNFTNVAGEERKDADDRNQHLMYRPLTGMYTNSEPAKAAGLPGPEESL